MSQTKHNVHLWLRDETKPHERRTALTPAHARTLIEAGFRITVESSEVRCFPDQEYVQARCAMVAPGSWRQAPADAIILGLKELPEEDTPLFHRHIYFAHAYKGQKGWEKTISRFKRGGGLLFDMEFLVDDGGRRVAAFGRWAGFSGAALAADIWAHQQSGSTAQYPAVERVNQKDDLIRGLRQRLKKASNLRGRAPRVLIIGAKGRCGAGAADLFEQVDLPPNHVTLWDKDETVTGGPFRSILDHDIFVNCVLVQGEMRPFLTRDLLTEPRQLSVISDVSCDPTSPHNPIPLYDRTTTFAEPSIRLADNPVLDLTAIDHLPSLLPRESSADYGDQLLPHLQHLSTGSPVWKRAKELYENFESRLTEETK